jgi:hypothetical protein
MLLTKLKTATAVLLVAATITGYGVGLWMHPVWAAGEPESFAVMEQVPPPANERPAGQQKIGEEPRPVSQFPPSTSRTVRGQIDNEPGHPLAPPAESPALEPSGSVEKIDDDLVLVSVSAGQVLKTGDTLEVYRLQPAPVYCGQIRVLFVKDTAVVCRVSKKVAERIQVKDLVASRLVAAREGRSKTSEVSVELPGAAKLSVKVYQVGSLVRPGDGKPEEAALVQLVTRIIEPASWDTMGGSGSIEYFALGKCLVVNQTAEIHERIEALLNALHDAKGDQEKKGR